jgi:dTDP-L-rhamnose 4-epimerase
VNVLVTGGAGFIGSHTVDALLQRGHKVRVLDALQARVHPTGWPCHLAADAERVVGDVRSSDTMLRALAGVDAVLHLAAYQDYMPDFSTFLDVNARGTALLFELIVANPILRVAKVVVASSQAVAGEARYACRRCLGVDRVPSLAEQCDEPELAAPFLADPRCVQPPLRSLEQLQHSEWEHLCPVCEGAIEPLLMKEGLAGPSTAYGISKYAAERLSMELAPRHGIATAAMRYTYVQGSRNAWQNAYSGLLRRLALAYIAGVEPTLYEDGQQLRDFVNVADVAAANVLVLERNEAAHKVYNVGGGRPVRVVDIARLVAQEFGAAAPTASGDVFRVGDTRHTVSDISRLRTLGWRPRVPVESSVREYVQWLEEQKPDPQRLAEAEAAMARMGVIRRTPGVAGRR